jgi:hypothetical protein
MFPKRAPIRGRTAHNAFAYLSKTSSFRFPGKGAFPEAPSWNLRESDTPSPAPHHPALKVSGRRALLQDPPKSGAPMKRDARLETLFKISFRAPREAALPAGSLHRASRRETLHPQSPFIQLSKSSVDEPSSRFSRSGAPIKRCPSQEPFLNVYQGARRGSPSYRFPFQSHHGERHSIPRAPSAISRSPGR